MDFWDSLPHFETVPCPVLKRSVLGQGGFAALPTKSRSTGLDRGFVGIGENLDVLDIVQTPVVAKRGISCVQDFNKGQGWSRI